MKAIFVTACLLWSALGLPAQELLRVHDFLTDHEEDLIRMAQDPDSRTKHYLHFAQLRLELVRQALGIEKAGRSQQIYQNLEQYGRIIETIDIVIEDALVRKLDVSKALKNIVEQEQEFLNALQKITDNAAEDQWRYEFVLQDAIEITQDSIEVAQEDLGERTREIMEADQREEKKRLETMTPERREEVTQVKQEEQGREAERERKRPTLLKPGETVKKQ